MSISRHKETRELARLWAQWVEVVADAAKGGRRVKRRSDKEYADLHASLLRQTEDSLIKDSQGQFRQLFLQMKAECLPWVSLEAFSTAEKQILFGVLDRSMRIHRQLSVGHYVAGKFFRRTLKLAGLAFTACLTYLLIASPVVYEEFRVLSYRAWYLMRDSNLLTWLAAVVIIVVVAGVWMLKSTREY